MVLPRIRFPHGRVFCHKPAPRNERRMAACMLRARRGSTRPMHVHAQHPRLHAQMRLPVQVHEMVQVHEVKRFPARFTAIKWRWDYGATCRVLLDKFCGLVPKRITVPVRKPRCYRGGSGKLLRVLFRTVSASCKFRA